MKKWWYLCYNQFRRGELMKAVVEYVNHSGYLVETENHILLVDYVKGELPKFDKPTLVISTHAHADHFNKEILDIEGPVRILLSSDIKEEHNLKHQSNVFYIEPNSRRFVGDFQVETFGSTDQGISVFVYVDNIGIFHAGDLNLWIWEDEDTQEDKREMSKEFDSEIKKIRRKNVEIAMFPVDPRLGRYATSGVTYFMDIVKPTYLFPMHFWNDPTVAKNLEESNTSLKTKILVPEHDNQKFEIEI